MFLKRSTKKFMDNSNLNKIKTYVGFAKKSGSIVFGVDKISECKNLKLVLVSDAISENSLKKIEQTILKTQTKSAIIKRDEFKIIVCGENILAIGMKDENLSNAISSLL